MTSEAIDCNLSSSSSGDFFWFLRGMVVYTEILFATLTTTTTIVTIVRILQIKNKVAKQ